MKKKKKRLLSPASKIFSDIMRGRQSAQEDKAAPNLSFFVSRCLHPEGGGRFLQRV